MILRPFHNVVPIDFCESRTLPTLTKYIEKTVYVYNIKHVHFENLTHNVSNECAFDIKDLPTFLYKHGQSL